MLDRTAAPETGAEAGSAPEQIAITDEASAADAFLRSGLLGNIPDGDGAEHGDGHEEQDSGHEPEDGAEETPPTGEEEGQSEPQPAAAIEPPKSWSDQDKAVFGTLPADAKAIIARRQSEQDRAFLQKTEEVANERKATEAERKAMQDATAQYQQNLHKLTLAAMPDMAEFAKLQDPAWAAQNPAEAVVLQSKLLALQSRFGAINGELQRITQQQQQELRKRQDEYLAAESKKLAERVPEFADADKAKALSAEIGKFLQGHGYTPEEIAQASDHRAVAMAVKLMRYEQAEATRKAAEARKTPAQSAPRVQRPGTPADNRDAASQRLRNDIGQFAKSKSVVDAARFFEHLL